MASNVILQPLEDRRRVYVSGPMRGVEDLNRAAFADATTRLRAIGHAVVNPHEINDSWERSMTDRGLVLYGPDYLRRDLVELMQCDAILLLPGWQDSVGARCEIAVAFTLGLGVMVFQDAAGMLGVVPDDRVTVHCDGYKAAPGPVPAEGATDGL